MYSFCTFLTFSLFLNYCEDVTLSHHKVALAVDIQLGAGILAIQHLVSNLYLHLNLCCARTYGYNLTCCRLLLCCIWNNQSASRSCLGRIREYKYSV